MNQDGAGETKKRRLALLRLVLGQAQIVGATVTLYFMLTKADARYTLWLAAVTAVITAF